MKTVPRALVKAALLVAALGSGHVVAANALERCGYGAGAQFVGVTKEAVPFAIAPTTPTGAWSGISIELWREVSAALGTQTNVFSHADTIEQVLANVRDQPPTDDSGRLVVGVGAITVTAEREKGLDFSHPYFQSSIGIAVNSESTSIFRYIWNVATSPQFWGGLLVLAIILAVVGVLIWAVEHGGDNPEFPGFPRGYSTASGGPQ